MNKIKEIINLDEKINKVVLYLLTSEESVY